MISFEKQRQKWVVQEVCSHPIALRLFIFLACDAVTSLYVFKDKQTYFSVIVNYVYLKPKETLHFSVQNVSVSVLI